MKLLTVAEAQADLAKVLKRVRDGEDVAIVSEAQIIELKPTSIVGWEDSYLFQEYEISPKEWANFKEKIGAKRTRRKYKRFEGTFDPKQLD